MDISQAAHLEIDPYRKPHQEERGKQPDNFISYKCLHGANSPENDLQVEKYQILTLYVPK